MAPPSSAVTELATAISRNTKIVNDYLTSGKHPLPSFDVDGPIAVSISPTENAVVQARDQILADTQALNYLIKGPSESLMGIAAINVNDVVSLQAMHRFKVAERFPLDEKVSYEFLSHACGVNEMDLTRLIRHAMTNHIFREENGLVAHTATSKALRDNEQVKSLVAMLTNELFPGVPHTINALVKYNGFHAPNQSGFSLGNRIDKGLYEELRQHPERATAFVAAMNGFAARESVDPLAQGWDWASVDAAKGTVVDIGGSWGPVCIALAKSYPNIRFIVQDFADVVAGGAENLPAELKSRIKFMPYSFMEEEQPVHDASVYFMRAILHNWPDPYCVTILRSLLPALRKGAHILVQDEVRGETWKLPPYEEKYRRSWDLNMTTLFGSRERTFKDWEKIIKDADPKLSVKFCDMTPSQLHVLDITWT